MEINYNLELEIKSDNPEGNVKLLAENVIVKEAITGVEIINDDIAIETNNALVYISIEEVRQINKKLQEAGHALV